MEAAPLTGADPAPVATALDAVLRDKNQALDALDKVLLLSHLIKFVLQSLAMRRRRDG